MYFFPEDRIESYLALATSSCLIQTKPKEEKKETYHIPFNSLPPKDLPLLNAPNPNRKEGIQNEIRRHGCDDPWRLRSFPA